MGDPYVCIYCGKVFPLPSLARDHEAEHERGSDAQ